MTALGSAKIMAFVATSDPDRAKTFYRDQLGLRLLSEDPFAVVFEANGTMLRVQIVPKVAAPHYTTLGWEVSDIAAAAKALEAAGVKLEHYGFPGQDERSIWTSPGGALVAWFKDPDGNLLSITQF